MPKTDDDTMSVMSAPGSGPDVSNETKAMRRYARDLASRGVKVTVDFKMFKSAPLSANGSKIASTASASSGYNIFCTEIFDINNIFDIIPGDLYNEVATQKNLSLCFENMNTNSLFYTLRYLFQEILVILQNMRCQFSASKSFYKKIYEVVLAIGRPRRGLYLKCERKVSQETIRLIHELEELLDEKRRALRVYTYPDEYIQYILYGTKAKSDFASFEALLSSIMTRLYTEINKGAPNPEDKDEFIGLIPVDPYGTVGDVEQLINVAKAFPKLDPPTEAPKAEGIDPASPGSPSSPLTPSSPKHLIRSLSFNSTSSKNNNNPRRTFDLWRFFVIKNYKALFELLDPAKFPATQFINAASGAPVDADSGEADDISKDFVFHLAGEFQKILRKYEKMLAVVEVSSYPSYANAIPIIPLRVFWAKYLGDVYEVNLSVFQRALVEYLMIEASYTAPKAKSFAYPVVKALQYYGSLTTVSLGPKPRALSPTVSAKKGADDKSDSAPISGFTTTVFDLVAFTASIPPAESDTLIKFFKAFVKQHLNGTVAVFPNQDHLAIFNPFDPINDKEMKKVLHFVKTRKGFINVPLYSPPRKSGRSATMLFILSRIKTDIQCLYLDFNHASSEASLIASLLSQLHLKYTSGSDKQGSVPMASALTLAAATKYVTKQLFFEYFAMFLEKLGKEAVIVFDNIEPQSIASPAGQTKEGERFSLVKRPSFNRSFSVNSTGLNSNAVSEFMGDLISFCHDGPSYLKRFSFVFVGGPAEKFASYEAEGISRTFELPNYTEAQLKAMALEVYPQDYLSVYELSNEKIGNMVTVSEIFTLKDIRDLVTLFESKKEMVAATNGMSDTTRDEDEDILATVVFNAICASFSRMDDELLCASCVLPNVGAFHYAFAWYMCRKAFKDDIMKWHAAFMNLNRLGYFDYLGNNLYVISKYYNPETSFEYRNFFAPSTGFEKVETNLIYFPFVGTIVLQEQWDLYYEYWSKEMYRMCTTALTSSQVLDNFPVIYPHFRQVFANFGLFPRITLTNPRRPSKRMIVNIEAYEKFKAKAQLAAKDKEVQAATKETAPAATATSPAKNDQSKLKTTKLSEVAITLGGGVSKVLARYYPTTAGQLIAASIIEAIDVEAITKAINSNGMSTSSHGSEVTMVAGETNDDDDDDDTPATTSSNSTAYTVHPLEEKYYGALCDFVEQLLREDTEPVASPMYMGRDRFIRQCSSILAMFFSLKQMSKNSVKPALIWVRCLVLSGSVKKELKQDKKARQYYQRAYEMVCELESLSGNASLASDPLEPLGKYKQDLMAILLPSQGDRPSVNLGQYELTGGEIRRQASIASNASNGRGSFRRQQSVGSTGSGSGKGKDDKCHVM